MLNTAPKNGFRIALLVAAFAFLSAAIMSRPPKSFNSFDQLSYLTIAYDIHRYGVFSNGIFDQTDSNRTAPAAGMFFVPGYPMLVLAAMKLDSRFAISLYSIFMLFTVLAWKTSRIRYFALAGIFLGLLCLTRPSFVVVIPVMLALIVLNGRWHVQKNSTPLWTHLLVFVTACFVVVGPVINTTATLATSVSLIGGRGSRTSNHSVEFLPS